MTAFTPYLAEIADIVCRLCRCASNTGLGNLLILSGDEPVASNHVSAAHNIALKSLWGETLARLGSTSPAQTNPTPSWQDIGEFRALMVDESEAITLIIRHMFVMAMKQPEKLPAAVPEISVGLDNCLRSLKTLEATTLLGAILFQDSAGIGSQERLILAVAELVAVVCEFFRCLGALMTTSRIAEVQSGTGDGGMRAGNVQMKTAKTFVQKAMKAGKFLNSRRNSFASVRGAAAPSAEKIAENSPIKDANTDIWAVQEKLQELNQCGKALVSALNTFLNVLLSVERHLVLQRASSSLANGGDKKSGIRRLRDALENVLRSQQISDVDLEDTNLSASEHVREVSRDSFGEEPLHVRRSKTVRRRAKSLERVSTLESCSSLESDHHRTGKQGEEETSFNFKMGMNSTPGELLNSVQTLYTEGEDPPEGNESAASVRRPRSLSHPTEAVSSGRLSFPTQRRATGPSQLRQEISAEPTPHANISTSHTELPSAAPDIWSSQSALPSPYEDLLRHIEEIEQTQLEMLKQSTQHNQRSPATQPKTATYIAAPKIGSLPSTFSIAKSPMGGQIINVGINKRGMVGSPSSTTSLMMPPPPHHVHPKIAVAQIKKEWEPSLTVKRQLLRQDSGMTSWKLCVAKLSHSSHSLLIFPSGRATVKDMDFPVRDPELSGASPIAAYNLRNAVIEKASNVPRHKAIRARLMNGVNVLIDVGSDARLEDWMYAMRRIAEDESATAPSRRDSALPKGRDSRVNSSTYLSYPSASSFVI
ncbi:uncharacterized protein SPPG_02023 [Spizellomyces punctatus DAOM BR117]|uniref:PH domain-containing protein n=1 Tax=Spizellomyces punctatus (strain DAOM BR117) TaxID=645134 RepID=A0A0L0HQ59_SPIPD|nr:uncharacterized protein SPPG_02023 [Spizellomyces punctatus DAOM BR117]KND02944.1 hypothetical protein SPPG_02023 [Spizellomyces punctatus DAOM BR117]|eukprot:XP_016610983.1 hypothetical protein SPPG_02023 [Spizellomyces punctatus DAOM BR117]